MVAEKANLRTRFQSRVRMREVLLATFVLSYKDHVHTCWSVEWEVAAVVSKSYFPPLLCVQ